MSRPAAARNAAIERRRRDSREEVVARGEAARTALGSAVSDVLRHNGAARPRRTFTAPRTPEGTRIAEQVAAEATARLGMPGTATGMWDGRQAASRRTLATREGLRVERRPDGAVAIVPTTEAGRVALNRALEPERRRTETRVNRSNDGTCHFRGDDPLGIADTLAKACAAMALHQAQSVYAGERRKRKTGKPTR